MNTSRASSCSSPLTSAAKLLAPLVVACVALAAAAAATGAEYVWDPNEGAAGTGGNGDWANTGPAKVFRLPDLNTYKQWQTINDPSAVVLFGGLSNVSSAVNITGSGISVAGLIFETDYELTGNTLRLAGTASSPSVIQIDAGQVATFGMASVTAAALNLTGRGTFVFGRENLFTGTPAIVLDGGTTMNLGTFSQAVGGFTLMDGIITNGTLSATAYTFANGSVGAALNGAADLLKTGNGTVTLSAASNFSGSTRIDGGTLALAITSALPSSSNVTVTGGRLSLGNSISQAVGSLSVTGGRVNLATGAVLSSSSATASSFSGANSYLSGTGNFSSAVSIGSGAHISPASEGTVGRLYSGPQTWATGGAYAWNISNATGAAGIGWDALTITGGLTITGPFTLQILGTSVTNFPATSYSWAIATASSISGNAAGLISIDTSGFDNSLLKAGTFSIGQSATDLNLIFTPVPEPKDYAMILGAFTLGLVGYRRWRRTAQYA